MSKYLYGAAVQGIQEFIFKTNELKHIVGASELVEWICTDAFKDFAKNGESVVRAAGNIKFIFEEEKDCARAVREFPKKVMTMAPGITISQAVVLLDDDFETAEDGEGEPYKFEMAVSQLESRLKTQRNKVPQSVTAGLMGIKRANNTGFPVTKVDKDKDGNIIYLDDATRAKLGKVSELEKEEEKQERDPKLRVWYLCEKSFGIPVRRKNIAYDISKITGKNDWIAVIHADGNGFGKVIQKVGKDKDKFKVFSRTLDVATRYAARIAFAKLLKKGKINKDGIIPIRPVVLDGDDMTTIIRGDLAIDYATEFINAFEVYTGKKTEEEEIRKVKIKTWDILGEILQEYRVFEDGKNYLTACAGIAFIKSSYPFYFGYQLAEELCGQAKKDTKALAKEGKPQTKINEKGKEEKLSYLPNSCLMFHKVQDSFITNYNDIVTRELTADDGLSFKAGPYYQSETANRYKIQDLKNLGEKLNNENGDGIKSGIRQWITARLDDKNFASQKKNRMLMVFNSDQSIVNDLTKEEKRKVMREGDYKERLTCIAYDVLAYHTIMNQKTNEETNE